MLKVQQEPIIDINGSEIYISHYKRNRMLVPSHWA